MMKKLLLLVLIFLNFTVLPADAVEKKVVIDRLTQSEAEDLDIEIPDSVPPGFHSITIEVYDDNGTITEKEIEFCKDEKGVVQWDNKCPNLNLEEEPAPVDPEPVKAINVGLQPYDPLDDPETTKGLYLAGFAALAALTSIKRNEKQSEEEQLSLIHI